MAFGAEDLQAFLRALARDPAAQRELARLTRDEELRRLAAEVAALAEAQRRTEERLNALAEAQRRTEERLERLEAVVAELTEALRGVLESIRALRTEVGTLAQELGVSVEADAESVLLEVLADKGLQVVEPPRAVAVDGEVDVAAAAQDPQGRRVWVLVEVKLRLHGRDVRAWAQRARSEAFQLRLAREGIEAPYLVYAFGMRIYRDAEAVAREEGIGILNHRGEQLAPASR